MDRFVYFMGFFYGQEGTTETGHVLGNVAVVSMELHRVSPTPKQAGKLFWYPRITSQGLLYMSNSMVF